jgi:hypothetical protein
MCIYFVTQDGHLNHIENILELLCDELKNYVSCFFVKQKFHF